MEPIAQFKVSEDGRNGTLSVFPDRVERASHGVFRKNTGVEVIPFSRVSSVEMERGLVRQEVVIHAGGNAIKVGVYGVAAELVRLLNAGMAGQLGQQHAAAPAPSPQPVSAGPPPGWYNDPGGAPVRRWWDGV